MDKRIYCSSHKKADVIPYMSKNKHWYALMHPKSDVIYVVQFYPVRAEHVGSYCECHWKLIDAQGRYEDVAFPECTPHEVLEWLSTLCDDERDELMSEKDEEEEAKPLGEEEIDLDQPSEGEELDSDEDEEPETEADREFVVVDKKAVESQQDADYDDEEDEEEQSSDPDDPEISHGTSSE